MARAIRFSGAALILLLCLHVGVFGRVRSGQFVLYEFTTLKMLVQVLLAAALAVSTPALADNSTNIATGNMFFFVAGGGAFALDNLRCKN